VWAEISCSQSCNTFYESGSSNPQHTSLGCPPSANPELLQVSQVGHPHECPQGDGTCHESCSMTRLCQGSRWAALHWHSFATTQQCGCKAPKAKLLPRLLLAFFSRQPMQDPALSLQPAQPRGWQLGPSKLCHGGPPRRVVGQDPAPPLCTRSNCRLGQVVFIKPTKGNSPQNELMPGSSSRPGHQSHGFYNVPPRAGSSRTCCAAPGPPPASLTLSARTPSPYQTYPFSGFPL